MALLNEKAKATARSLLEIKEVLALILPVVGSLLVYFKPDYVGGIVSVSTPTVEVAFWFSALTCPAAVVTLIWRHRLARAKGRFRYNLGLIFIVIAIILAGIMRSGSDYFSASPPPSEYASILENVSIFGVVAFITTLFSGIFRIVLETILLK